MSLTHVCAFTTHNTVGGACCRTECCTENEPSVLASATICHKLHSFALIQRNYVVTSQQTVTTYVQSTPCVTSQQSLTTYVQSAPCGSRRLIPLPGNAATLNISCFVRALSLNHHQQVDDPATDNASRCFLSVEPDTSFPLLNRVLYTAVVNNLSKKSVCSTVFFCVTKKSELHCIACTVTVDGSSHCIQVYSTVMLTEITTQSLLTI